MKMVFWAGVGTLFPFLMTTLGAALVFLMKKQSEDGPCMGFAAGVMSAAAVFSMILPAMRQNEGGWLSVTLGFMLGAAMIAGVDALMCRVRRIQNASDSARKRLMMVAAITLHNIPEGMAVGLAFALAGVQGGDQQIASRIACNEVDLLLFFRDPINAKPSEPNEMTLLRLCDVHNIPMATNIATAEVLIHGLERGDLDWRDIVHPQN